MSGHLYLYVAAIEGAAKVPKRRVGRVNTRVVQGIGSVIGRCELISVTRRVTVKRMLVEERVSDRTSDESAGDACEQAAGKHPPEAHSRAANASAHARGPEDSLEHPGLAYFRACG
jgi:hypothetical protein